VDRGWNKPLANQGGLRKYFFAIKIDQRTVTEARPNIPRQQQERRKLWLT